MLRLTYLKNQQSEESLTLNNSTKYETSNSLSYENMLFTGMKVRAGKKTVPEVLSTGRSQRLRALFKT